MTDLRHLNSRIKPLHYCSPLLKDSFKKISSSNSTICSTLDIKAAFHSLRVNKKSQKYLHICGYPSAKMLYYKMLMGLKVSPSEWGEALDNIPDHESFILAMAEDILIMSEDEKQHIKHINALLTGLRKYGLKIAPNKCELFKTQVQYMCHVCVQSVHFACVL